jgi:hypothetical protein
VALESNEKAKRDQCPTTHFEDLNDLKLPTRSLLLKIPPSLNSTNWGTKLTDGPLGKFMIQSIATEVTFGEREIQM